MANSENFQHEPEIIASESRIYRWKDLDAAVKQGRAEALVACKANIAQAIHVFDGCRDRLTDDLKIRLSAAEGLLKSLDKLQPAAKDPEELLDKVHEAALPHAAEQLLKALTEGGEFAVGSPLDKAKKRVEELLRKAELKGRLCILRENPGLCNGDTDNPERHARLCKYHQEVAELEKARDSLEKS